MDNVGGIPQRMAKKEKSYQHLVRRETVIIDEIAAHPPCFAEFFTFGTGECLERTILVCVDERVVVIVHVVCICWVWVECGAG